MAWKLIRSFMKIAVRGRIVLWEGASLWALEVPLAALARRNTEIHAHHAIQLTLSVGGSFYFQIGAEVVEGPVVIIAPDVPHAFFPQGQIAMIFIEPESKAGAAVLNDLADRKFAKLDPARYTHIANRLSGVWQQPRPDDATLVELGRELAARLAGDVVPVRTIDKRIARVLERLSADIDSRLDAGQAAEIACLSESRFSHLFVAEVGLPYRTYVLWRRLMAAVNGIAAGNTLTNAAHEAGFADSAHFSRTFLRMFGVPASLLLMI
jgi:AraC family transcriptional regulator